MTGKCQLPALFGNRSNRIPSLSQCIISAATGDDLPDISNNMSQRRGASAPKEAAVEEEMVPFAESLDKPSVAHMERSTGTAPPSVGSSVGQAPGSLSLEERYESENQNLRVKQWKEGHFAASMTTPTWNEEYQKWKSNFREECAKFDDNGGPCICCSAVVCGMLGAGRLGHMAVLKQSTEWVEEEEEDEDGEVVTRRYTRPRLDCIVGPVSPCKTITTLCSIVSVFSTILFFRNLL